VRENDRAAKDADQFLVEQFRSGDHAAFDVLVHRHYERIYELVYYFTHNVEDAYDITQEVFLRVFSALATFKGDAAFYTWLYRIALNACTDYRRRRARYRDVELTDEVLHGGDARRFSRRERTPPENTLRAELSEQIQRAISVLPAKQRQVFVLRYMEDLSLQEIATIVGRELGTVKAHLFHATRKMRRLLAPYAEQWGLEVGEDTSGARIVSQA
jgi:RNA polymerase sigma-70 factor (ECF subfamily)